MIRTVNAICPVPVAHIVFDDDTKKSIIKSFNDLDLSDTIPIENRESKFIKHYYNNDNILSKFKSLLNIKFLFESEISSYYRDVLGYSSDLNINQSWINVCSTNGFQGSHYHANSVVSGTFFLSYKKDENPILEFIDPQYSMENTGGIRSNIIVDNRSHVTDWAKDFWTIDYDEGDLLLWPSYLRHGYQKNHGSIRKSVSFNSMPKSINNLYSLTDC